LNQSANYAQKFDQLGDELDLEKNIDNIIDGLLIRAMGIMNSDFASIQIYNAKNRSLVLLGHKNFKPDSARFWNIVFPGTGATCGEALKKASRATVKDVREVEYIKGSGDLLSFEHSGIRSVQSTPLVSFKEEMVGMMSTHWRVTRDFDNDDFTSFDHLTRFAADLLEKQKHLFNG
jgi:hypothetical protein